MFGVFRNRLTVQGTLVAQTALRVGTGRAIAPVGADLPVLRNGRGEPFIPGSSLKGALRSHLEALLRGWWDSPFCACNPVDEQAQCIRSGRRYARSSEWRYPENVLVLDKPIGLEDLRQGLEELPTEGRESLFAERLEANLCLACRTFGSPWLASRVQFRDLPPLPGYWIGQFAVRDGVAIDRDKGTAVDGGLYDYEVVPAGTPFGLQLAAENLEDWQLGLLWLGLKALERTEIALGGFTSRGLGWVKLVDRKARLATSNDLLLLLAGGSAGSEIDDQMAQPWARALRAEVGRREECHAQATAK